MRLKQLAWLRRNARLVPMTSDSTSKKDSDGLTSLISSVRNPNYRHGRYVGERQCGVRKQQRLLLDLIPPFWQGFDHLGSLGRTLGNLRRRGWVEARWVSRTQVFARLTREGMAKRDAIARIRARRVSRDLWGTCWTPLLAQLRRVLKRFRQRHIFIASSN